MWQVDTVKRIKSMIIKSCDFPGLEIITIWEYKSYTWGIRDWVRIVWKFEILTESSGPRFFEITNQNKGLM